MPSVLIIWMGLKMCHDLVRVLNGGEGGHSINASRLNLEFTERY